MKVFSTILILFFFCTATTAGISSEKIRITSNAKTSLLELKFNSTYKKNFQANIVITNAEGKQVSIFKCEIVKGLNVVILHEALNFKEGIYTVEMTVKKRKSSTQFILFNRFDTNS